MRHHLLPPEDARLANALRWPDDSTMTAKKRLKKSGSAGQAMRTTLPDARTTPRFAGVATFGRFPLLAQVPPVQQPVDWAIYGVPFDGGITFRPGARFGPRAIREASQYLKPAHLEHRVNIVEHLSLADAGDAPVRPYSTKQTIDETIRFAGSIGEKRHTRLFAIGGDHSVAYANIRATWERLGKPRSGLALLHFDAHLDTVDEVWGEKWTHASPFLRAINDGLVDPKRMASIGIRGPLNTLRDLDFAHDHGVQIISYDTWRNRNGKELLASFIKRLGDDPTYLTFDIDVVDPAFAPGTGTPSAGGFTSAEVFDIIRSCAGVKLVGADLVEVLPDRDPAGITSILASHLIGEILALAAVEIDRSD